MKKNKSKKQEKKARSESRKELALLLSRVLRHPLLPNYIYNELGEAICASIIDGSAPEFIELHLMGHEREEKRKGEKARRQTQSEVDQ